MSSKNQIVKNQVKTIILICVYLVLICFLSYLIGYYLGSVALGIGIACFIIFILLPIQMLLGKKTVGSRTHWRPINSNNPDEKEAFFLIQNLSLEAGLTEMPQIYIVPSDVPNAFAGGLKIKDCYIGITEGLLRLLNKEETEGVIAHEISHIVNRDILVSTVSIYLMSAAIILGTVFLRISRSGIRSSSRSGKKGSGAAAAIILFLIGILLSILIRIIASLINLAISRKREYIADANAVKLCGNSQGLANALERISNTSKSYTSQQVDGLGGQEMLCLYIFNPGKWLLPLFSTHPPIEKRIELIKKM